ATALSGGGIHADTILLIIIIVLIVAVGIVVYLKFMRGKFGNIMSTGEKGFKVTFDIMDENKNPINDAFLLIQKSTGEIEYSNKIPSKVTIPNLEKGIYNIKIFKENYDAINQQIDLKGDMCFEIKLSSEKGKGVSESKILFKKVPSGENTIEILVTTPNNIPVKNAKIYIGDKERKGTEIITNSDGICTLTLPNGEYIIYIEKNLCEPAVKHIKVGKENKRFHFFVTPSVSLSTDQKRKLQEIYSSVLNAFNEISTSYERTIPKYIVKIAEKIIKEVERQGENINFETEEEYRRNIDAYINAAEISMRNFSSGMLENRNIILYAKLASIEKEIDPPDPPDVGKMSISQTLNLLSEIDNVLIYEIRNITIYPAAFLWKTAKILLENPTEANAHIAGIILNATDFMLKNEELRRRLSVTIV
ncbi:MAG: hypothetical protein ACK4YO_01415, partial [Candidatus Altarchaeaceae archaeon]